MYMGSKFDESQQVKIRADRFARMTFDLYQTNHIHVIYHSPFCVLQDYTISFVLPWNARDMIHLDVSTQ